MKWLLLSVFALTLVACGGGGGNTAFPGVWSGSFTSLVNNCPFSLASDLNSLFPMTINEEADGTITVQAADGSLATGGQGEGEKISFTAQAAVFGNYGSILPYTCTSFSRVGYLGVGDTEAKVSVVVLFNNCTTPSTTSSPISCHATYTGEASKVN